MAKFCGKIGFGITREIRPGVCDTEIIEREYYGDMPRNMLKNESAGKVNDDLNISNTVSIISDNFAYQNFYSMKYVELYGAKWKIRNVEVLYPRLLLTVGGVWNEED